MLANLPMNLINREVRRCEMSLAGWCSDGVPLSTSHDVCVNMQDTGAIEWLLVRALSVVRRCERYH